ncbi:TetR/AcrR family transcriptional regulator [Alkalihalobacterium elongatum]|uniref:TetR/AcrR family transcriptional regulator n=1 Tax=Alkalihalobacterium elongatum TaxID=2675466 RepID=UPI001C1F315F|nr:TetR/AcrR family transcriptional regulator [Alkalihalobacterium elongatum]
MATKRISAKERKKMILRAAIEEFSKSNYRQAKVPEIAGLAEVTEPMVYRHFASKKNLFLATLSVIGEKTIERLEKSVENYAHSTPEKIEELMENYLKSMATYRKELKIYYQAISEFDDPEIKAVLDHTYRQYAHFITSIVEEGKRKGDINQNVDSNQFGWNLVGVLIHLSTFYLLDFFNPATAKHLIQQHLRELRE